MVETCILHALYKAGHLNVYHAAAVVAHVLFVLGQMRQLAVAAGKLGLGKLRAPRNLEVGVLACAVDLFPRLEGIEDCYISGDKLKIIISDAGFEKSSKAITHYYGENLFIIEKEAKK